MDESVIASFTTLISNMGVPIACLVVSVKLLIDERNARTTETKEWLTAINNNTRAIEKLVEVVGKDG